MQKNHVDPMNLHLTGSGQSQSPMNNVVDIEHLHEQVKNPALFKPVKRDGSLEPLTELSLDSAIND
jgi:hypothetical protein